MIVAVREVTNHGCSFEKNLGRHLFEVESMGDVVCCQEGSDQMGD